MLHACPAKRGQTQPSTHEVAGLTIIPQTYQPQNKIIQATQPQEKTEAINPIPDAGTAASVLLYNRKHELVHFAYIQLQQQF
jgi:hypothetical protein